MDRATKRRESGMHVHVHTYIMYLIHILTSHVVVTELTTLYHNIIIIGMAYLGLVGGLDNSAQLQRVSRT